MENYEYIVAGTGHRPDKLGGYNKLTHDKLKQIAINWFTEQNRLWKIDKAITGMAIGWDLALAHAAIELKTPLVAAIPFKGQELAWPKKSQEFYNWVLSKAYEIRTISDGSYSPYKMQVRNEWMVDNCHLLLAMWNGDDKGGTANCINYAKKKEIQIVNLYDHLTR